MLQFIPLFTVHKPCGRNIRIMYANGVKSKVYHDLQSRLKALDVPDLTSEPPSASTTALQVMRNSVPETHVPAKENKYYTTPEVNTYTAPQSNTSKVARSYTITPPPPSTSTSENVNQPTAHQFLPPQCIEENCLEYLSPKEKIDVSKCKKTTIERFGVKDVQKGTCKFMSDSSRQPVALASPEGSGNTWVRALLEKATGICTGFCCCDRQLRVIGFVGETVMSGKVLVVKTHIGFPQWIGNRKKLSWEGSYGSAVFLIRNPTKALIAEWNRRMTNKAKFKQTGVVNRTGLTVDPHTHIVSKSEFGKFSQYIYTVY